MYTLYETLMGWWNGFPVFNKLMEFCCVSIPVSFIKLKRRLKGIVCGTLTWWAVTQIGRCWVCGIGPMIDFLHKFAMLPGAKVKSGL